MARQDNPFALLDADDAEDVMCVLAKVEARMMAARHQEEKPTSQSRDDQISKGGAFPKEGKAGRGRGGGGGVWGCRGGGGGRRGRGRGYYHHEERAYANGYRRGDVVAAEGPEEGGENGRVVGVDGQSFGRDNGAGGGGGGNRYGGGYNGERRGFFRGGDGRQDGGGGRLNGRGGRWVATEKSDESAAGNANKETEKEGGGGRLNGRGGRWVATEKSDEFAAGNANKETEKEATASAGVPGSDGPVTCEVPKKTMEVPGKVVCENGSNKGDGTEANEMTLVEYEKLLLEKRKALGAVKTEGRQVDGKEFEGMQIVDRKKDDIVVVKPKLDKEKQKKDSLDREEKSRKAMTVNEFLKPTKGDRYYGPLSYAPRRFQERVAIKGGDKDAFVDGRRPTGEQGGTGGGLSSPIAGAEQFSQVPCHNNNASQEKQINLADVNEFPGLDAAAKM